MYAMDETPLEFVINGADYTSPLFKSDVVLANRAKYRRISNTEYAKTIDISLIQHVVNLIATEISIPKILDSYIELVRDSDSSQVIAYCERGLNWVKTQLNTTHQYTRLLYNDHIFSINLIEASKDVKDADWTLLIEYVKSCILSQIGDPVLDRFEFFDDSVDDAYHILTLECIDSVIYNKDECVPYTTTILANNPTTIRAFRNVDDALIDDSFVSSIKSEHHQKLIRQYAEMFTTASKMSLDEAIEEYNSNCKRMMRYIKESDYTEELNSFYYIKYTYMLAYDIKLANIIAEFVDTSDDFSTFDPYICTLNITTRDIRDTYTMNYGIESQSFTMAMIYKSHIIRNKEFICAKLRRSL